ncbi:MAG: archaellin/type IV pilin N-terminal domain-containing protein [Nanoarchaeota archaeon]
MKWKKRGVSTIIATVLIILLTIAAAALLAQFIVPYVKDNLSGSTECLNYRDYFQFKEKLGNNNYNCYNLGNNIKIKYGASISAVGNDSDFNIKGFNLVFIGSDGSTKPVRVIDGVIVSGGQGTVQTYNPNHKADNQNFFLANIKVPKTGETNTYLYTSIGDEDFVEMEVYPILKSDKICDLSDSIKLVNCAGIDL